MKIKCYKCQCTIEKADAILWAKYGRPIWLCTKCDYYEQLKKHHNENNHERRSAQGGK